MPRVVLYIIILIMMSNCNVGFAARAINLDCEWWVYHGCPHVNSILMTVNIPDSGVNMLCCQHRTNHEEHTLMWTVCVCKMHRQIRISTGGSTNEIKWKPFFKFSNVECKRYICRLWRSDLETSRVKHLEFVLVCPGPGFCRLHLLFQKNKS